ncbi:hypothetical protein [Rhodoflexus sp.]
MWHLSNFCTTKIPEQSPIILKSLAIRQKLNDIRGVANCYSDIGYAYLQQENTSIASEYLYKALATDGSHRSRAPADCDAQPD